MKALHSKWGLPNSLFLHHRSETIPFLQKLGEILFFPSPPPMPGYFFWTHTAVSVTPTPSPRPGSWTALGKLQTHEDQPQLGKSFVSRAVSLSKKFASRPIFCIFWSSGQFITVLIHFLKYLQACTPSIAEQALSLTEPVISRVQQEPACPSIATHIRTQMELEHPRVETLPCLSIPTMTFYFVECLKSAGGLRKSWS